MRCGRAARGVADPHQQRHQAEVGHQRGAAVGEERRRQAGERQQAGDPAEDDEQLPGDGEGQARGEQLAERVADDQRGAQAALDQDQVDHDHRGQAEQPELLADGRGDEVALRDRHLVGAPAAQPGAEQPAGAQPEQRLRHLVSGAVVVGERVQPGVHAGLHVAEGLVGDGGAAGEQHQADDQPAGALGGHVEHHDEDAEQQQRAAQVALEDQHEDRHDPHDDDRAEVAAARQLQAHHLAAGQGQHVALVHQVGGEEDDQADLGELTGLDGEAGHPDPQLGAVDLGDRRRQHGGDGQEHQAQQHEDVGVAGQQPRVADAEQHADEQQHPDRGPQQLHGGVRAGVGVGDVQPVDHHQAEPGEDGDAGQQQRVGVGREPADDEVRGGPQRGEPEAEGGQLRAQRAGDGQVDDALRGEGDRDGEGQQQGLGAATGRHRCAGGGGPGIGRRSGHHFASRQSTPGRDDGVVAADVPASEVLSGAVGSTPGTAGAGVSPGTGAPSVGCGASGCGASGCGAPVGAASVDSAASSSSAVRQAGSRWSRSAATMRSASAASSAVMPPCTRLRAAGVRSVTGRSASRSTR